jgi:hypothetical protein
MSFNTSFMWTATDQKLSQVVYMKKCYEVPRRESRRDE